MISKEAFRHLVLAGAKLIKSAIAIDKKCPFDGIEGVDPYGAYEHILSSVADVLGVPGVGDDLLRIYYADTVSLFVCENKYADEHFEKMFAMLNAVDEQGCVSEDIMYELDAVVKKVPDDELYWIRRNL